MKSHDKGWDIRIFIDSAKISSCICNACNSVCCDAVELGCDHNDEDIYLYCDKCLNAIIESNHNNCPIDNHAIPVIYPSRAARRQISKSMVHCPFTKSNSIAKIKRHGAENAHVIDTLFEDEKEGNDYQNVAIYQQQIYKNDQLALKMNAQSSLKSKCNWQGTLNDLINKHMKECCFANKDSLFENEQLKRLQQENKDLKSKLQAQATEKEKYSNIMMQYTNKIKEQHQMILQQKLDYKHKLEQQNDIIDGLRSEIMRLKESKIHENPTEADAKKSDEIWVAVIKELEGKINKLESELSSMTQENQDLNQQLKEQYLAIQMLYTDSENDEAEQKEIEIYINAKNEIIDPIFEFMVEKSEKKHFEDRYIYGRNITYKGSRFTIN